MSPHQVTRRWGSLVAAFVRGSRRAPSGTLLGQEDVDQTTLKWGLEAGLWKALTSKNDKGLSKGDQAKDLLKRYGGAYLLTSISFAIVSFAACYALVSAGAGCMTPWLLGSWSSCSRLCQGLHSVLQ